MARSVESLTSVEELLSSEEAIALPAPPLETKAALFEALGLAQSQPLSIEDAKPVLEKVRQDTSIFSRIRTAFNPFKPAIEIYSQFEISSAFNNDPFPSNLLIDLPVSATSTIFPIGSDAFINGRGANSGFNVDLERGRVRGLGSSSPFRSFKLAPGFRDVAGTNSNDVIKGSNGSNTLYGFDGNDTILGTKGNDQISGGNGLDTLNYRTLNTSVSIGQFGKITKGNGAGVDSLVGTGLFGITPTVEKIVGNRQQINSVDVSGAPNDVEINLQRGFINIDGITGGGRKGDFDISNFTNATGGFGDDILTGNGRDNVIKTTGPAFSIFPDFPFSSDPSTIIDRPIIATRLPDNDVVNGKNGNDTIVGGGGLDTLLGGGGSDTFVLGNTSTYFYRDDRRIQTQDDISLDFIDISSEGDLSIIPGAGVSSGFATLGDFQTGVDSIVLQGDISKYVLLGNTDRKQFILRDVDGSGGISGADDLIAVVDKGFATSDLSFV